MSIEVNPCTSTGVFPFSKNHYAYILRKGTYKPCVDCEFLSLTWKTEHFKRSVVVNEIKTLIKNIPGHTTW